MERIRHPAFTLDDKALSAAIKNGTIIESVFDRPVAILPDETHSRTEQRLRAIGKTAERRAIFVVFTLRRRGDDIGQ